MTIPEFTMDNTKEDIFNAYVIASLEEEQRQLTVWELLEKIEKLEAIVKDFQEHANIEEIKPRGNDNG